VIVLVFEFLLSSVPEGRLFGLDSQTLLQIIATLVNVSLLAFILSRLLYKPVQNFLQDRSEKIKGQMEQTRDDMAKATELKLLYEQKIKGAEQEREEILDDARKVAAETGRQIVAEAKNEADAIRTRAAANVEMEWERAQNEMRQAIIEVSAAMAEKFITLAINKETHDRLFAETMSELEGMTWRS
jgi:F-type H+-transporting ATPase subunit b